MLRATRRWGGVVPVPCRDGWGDSPGHDGMGDIAALSVIAVKPLALGDRCSRSAIGRLHEAQNAGTWCPAYHCATCRVVGAIEHLVIGDYAPLALDPHFIVIIVGARVGGRQSAMEQQRAFVQGMRRLFNHGASDGSALSGGAAPAVRVSRKTAPQIIQRAHFARIWKP